MALCLNFQVSKHDLSFQRGPVPSDTTKERSQRLVSPSLPSLAAGVCGWNSLKTVEF